MTREVSADPTVSTPRGPTLSPPRPARPFRDAARPGTALWAVERLIGPFRVAARPGMALWAVEAPNRPVPRRGALRVGMGSTVDGFIVAADGRTTMIGGEPAQETRSTM